LKHKKLNEITERLNGKPFLHFIETSVTKIPERLEEIDPSIFIVFNVKRDIYELHSLDNKGNTFCFNIPYRRLDSRVIALFRKGDLKNRSIKEILREVDIHNELMEKREQRYRKGELNAMAREVRPVFKKLAEEVY
jgi:hypothetical protein